MKKNFFIFVWVICIFIKISNGQKPNIQNDSGNGTAANDDGPRAENVYNIGMRDGEKSALYAGLVAGLIVLAVCMLIMAGFCVYKRKTLMDATQRVLYRSSDSSVLIRNEFRNAHGNKENGMHHMSRLAEKSDYPAYGVTGPNPLSYETGPNNEIDNNLNRNAEIYHYKQQKTKLKKIESVSSDNGSNHSNSGSIHGNEDINDEVNSDGEYTVYECPGLASTTDGPLEIHNPMFEDASSYANPSIDGVHDKYYSEKDRIRSYTNGVATHH